MLRLPPAIRLQLWATCFRTSKPTLEAAQAKSTPKSPVKRYATVITPKQWNNREPHSPSVKDDIHPLQDIVEAAKVVLDTRSSASEAEKTAFLEELQRRTKKPPTKSSQRRNFRERLKKALIQPEPLTALQRAVRGEVTSSPKSSRHNTDETRGTDQAIPKNTDVEETANWNDVLVSEESAQAGGEDVLRDAEFIQTRMAFPTKEDYASYPGTFHDILQTEFSGNPLLKIWQKYLRNKSSTRIESFLHTTLKPRSELPSRVAEKMPLGSYACHLTANLPGGVRISASAAGRSKRMAQRAASLHAMFKLHSSGSLAGIFDVLCTRIRKSSHPVEPAEVRHDAKDTSSYIGAVLDPQSLPTKGEYPGAPESLFLIETYMSALQGACRRHGIAFKTTSEPSEVVGDGRVRCTLVLDIGELFSDHVITTRPEASLEMLSKLHASGVLHQLFPKPISSSDSRPQAKQPHHDLLPPKLRTDMPTKQQYPNAPDELFDEVLCAVAINNACAKGGFVMKVEGNASKSANSTFDYQLLLDISDLTCIVANGSGPSKQLAKRVAWADATAKLHAAGMLVQLFPNPAPSEETAPSEPLSGDSIESRYDETDVVDIDERVLNQEKDAKMEIYNYAATLGVVPFFAVETVKLGGRKRVTRRSSKPSNNIRVTISLPELKIRVSSVAKDHATAEVAAALAFKREAEQMHLAGDTPSSPHGPNHAGLLTVDSAPQFFDMYRKLKRESNIELEVEAVDVVGQCKNLARVLVDNVEIGPSAVMASRKDAEAIAYLGAALAIVNQEPTLMTDFAGALKKGKGKVLREMQFVEAKLDTTVLHAMRDTLVTARRAGLPDIRETLGAEGASSGDRQVRSGAVTQQARESASKRLSEAQTKLERSEAFAEIRKGRDSLPMMEYRSQILDLVSANPYSIIVGATGSGKTTQVPQILFEDAIQSGRGGFCDVICTQPRRLAASSIAARVAFERNEPLRQTVGYHVRFDAKRPRSGGSITYCTTGILLEQLKRDADSVLDNVSHLVIDEVHERDISIDFLLNIVRQTTRARQAIGKPIPKVVLMSATLDQKLFSGYFSQVVNGASVPCPTLSVPGRTFPVDESYLEDILPDLEQSYGNSFANVLQLDLSASKELIESEMAFSRRTTGAASEVIIDWKRERIEDFDTESQTARTEKLEALVPISLLVSTIAHICKTTQDGAILAFLPGLHEIISTRDMLVQQAIFGIDFENESKYKICLLHSAIPAEEQQVVLDPVPQGCRKIILSTNIAETSVTVPDVKYVIDTGKLREKRYDQLRRITRLQCTWESNSNARQRAGRAGRVQKGHYYALFTRKRRQSLAASGLPELLRSDLQETCLAVKAQGHEEPVSDFLAQSIQPPPAQAVQIAIANLQAIEALTVDHDLTSLGRVLSKLPVHPTLGKMIILGIVFRCLDPMIVLSSMSSERPMWISPVNARSEAKLAHAKYAVGNSDHLALMNAFNIMRELDTRVSSSDGRSYAQTNFLHVGAFRSILSTAKQIEDILVTSGLIPETPNRNLRRSRFGGEVLNQYSDNTALVKALLLAGMHPNLGVKVSDRSRSHRTPTEHSVLVHPSSVSQKRAAQKPAAGDQKDVLFAYSTLARSIDGKALFMRDVTQVTPLMAMLFGGKLHTEGARTLVMDEWLPFKISADAGSQYAARLVLEFRKALDRMLFGAFNSIHDLQGASMEVQRLISDGFVDGIAWLLKEGENSAREQESWVPKEWAKTTNR